MIMSDVRAFIGHSFTRDDEPLIGVFQKYFTALQKSLSFSWVSAEPAEPTELAAKVLKLIEDKNVFIGICTRKQRSISPNHLASTKFPRGFLRGRADYFTWKTSDWIIQEIGLAVGRGLRLILLVEEGVERPGGLQGNIEYIQFSRDNPEACFTKILEMITALLPRLSSAITQTVDPRSAPAEEEVAENKPETAEWWRPTHEWNQRDYDFGLMHVIGIGDAEELRLLEEAYNKSSLKSEGDNAQRWEALSAFYRLSLGTDGTIAELKVLADKNPQSISVQEQLAKGLASVGEERAAALIFEAIAERATLPEMQERLLGQSARTFARANQDADTARVLAKMRALTEANPTAELFVLRTLVDIAKIRNDLLGSIPALERIIELVPDDHDAKFSLGYAHSQNSSDDLALLHYMKIPEHERDGAAWNNLGASSDAQGLPFRAVTAYKRAQGVEETLATSNLAAKFLKAGFLAEALSLCEQALKSENPHKNVALTWAEAKELPEQERERLDKVLANAGLVSAFYRLLGRAEAKAQPADFPPKWGAPEAIVTASINGDVFTAEGTYAVSSGLAGLLGAASPFVASSQPSEHKYRITYNGLLKGRTIHGTVHRRLESDVQPLGLWSEMDRPKVMMFLTDDASELKVMEKINAKSPRFYNLYRQKL
jgi:tetratricopeptide (TPR) repeat protein